MKKFMFVMLVLLLMYATAAFGAVEATGEGPSKEQALAAAMRKAVEQGVGVFIMSNTTVVDSALVDDKILSHSKGYITSYKILKEAKTVEGYTVTISAAVDNKTIKDDIDALTILRESIGNPRILVIFNKKSEGAPLLWNKDFVEEIYNGIVESLTDKQFRVVDKSTAQKFARQVAATNAIDVNLNQAAAFGLKYNAEYTLLYSVSGEIKEGAVSIGVKLRIKTQLIDNTRSLVVTSKVVESISTGQNLENVLEKAARDGGRKIVDPMIEVVQKSWMDMQQNGSLYTVVLDGVGNAEEIATFTGMLEKFPLVNYAREVESGGSKTTFETTYKGKRDQLDRDVIRVARELGWTLKKVRAEGARSIWKKQ